MSEAAWLGGFVGLWASEAAIFCFVETDASLAVRYLLATSPAWLAAIFFNLIRLYRTSVRPPQLDPSKFARGACVTALVLAVALAFSQSVGSNDPRHAPLWAFSLLLFSLGSAAVLGSITTLAQHGLCRVLRSDADNHP
ncbi:hypothetical protein G4G27_17550 [Sphingomonas sp. So64.6b]|uniref:hypothetical protein n=1 Tax=Sphingomonas sp. So64.6b TaxID=2997354 RepID=UPI00160435CF|nr:hypothetical protein [Sphingomonas sp. So64.6b]QNA85586.1 hypothetical protein G4G27_17550 [Sphingomonas sp. So64.6b]